jgi:hypothetical protein
MKGWLWLDDPLRSRTGFVMRWLEQDPKRPMRLQYGLTVWTLVWMPAERRHGQSRLGLFRLRYEAGFIAESTYQWPVTRLRLHRAVAPLSAPVPVDGDTAAAIEGLLKRAGEAIDQALGEGR